jgi:CubicO group peptidase (beta-lactamase class C family)
MRHSTTFSLPLIFLLVEASCLTFGRLLTSTGELDDLLERAQRCNNIPALAFAVTAFNQDSKTAFSRSLLYASNYQSRNGGSVDSESMSNRTLFCIGSLTKHVTAIMVLHLMELLQKRGYK